MSDPALWLSLVLAAVIVLTTTANVSLRKYSRTALADHLGNHGKEPLLEQLAKHRDDLLFITSLIRMGSLLALLLLLIHVFYQLQPPGMTPYLVIFGISIVAVMIFGVIVPNSWARYAGDHFLAKSLRPMFALRYVLAPLLALQHPIDSLVRRLAGVPKIDDEQHEAEQIEKEILDVVSEGELAGTVHEEDADMIESVMEFRDTEVGEIMTPRTEIVALPATATIFEAKDLITREGHSRIPIYRESLDDIRGVLYAKDLLNIDEDGSFDPLEMMRKVPFVPETKKISDLLHELQEKKVHLAIVLDEYGGTAGLVTIEDIVEEIVGEIGDEYEAPEPEPIRRLNEQVLEIDARVHVSELNEELGLELPEDEDYDTVGGFIFSQMGKIPTAGEEFTFKNARFSILDAEERKINRLRVERIQEPSAP